MACRNPTKCEMAAAKIREDNQASTAGGTVVTGTIDTEKMGMVRDFASQYLQENEGQPLRCYFSTQVESSGTQHSLVCLNLKMESKRCLLQIILGTISCTDCWNPFC